MRIADLANFAANKRHFGTVLDYRDFAYRFLEYRASGQLQAEIVAQSENQYVFLQYGSEADYQVSRPINTDLFASVEAFADSFSRFDRALFAIGIGEQPEASARPDIVKTIYTVQQCIGAALDALPAGKSNTARKVNGDLFERLINLLVLDAGVSCKSGVLSVPVKDGSGQTLFSMKYQHDMMIDVNGELKMIGSVKTSSKDRVDKVFIDKFLYGRLTGTDVPHIAIFLHDVQRKGTHPRYGISGTFLPGHFKGYTIKLNALDGVFYCDLRPQMLTDQLLAKHILSIDHFFYDLLPSLR